jgi:RND family efflux transporter MFP subunit
MLQAIAAKKSQLLAKMDQVKADIANAQIYIGYGKITSPIQGLVASKQAEVGLLAAPGVPLLTLEDPSRYRLEVPVEESMLKKIRIGTPVQISIDALGPQEQSRKVTEVIPTSDPASRSFMVKIDLSDEKGRSGLRTPLRSGLYGKARFNVGKKEVIQIPKNILLQQGQLVGVFVVDSSNIVHLRLIKTGKPYGDQIEVLSGINEGDRIIVEGLERIKEGDRVQ